jgi:hypothetical protein
VAPRASQAHSHCRSACCYPVVTGIKERREPTETWLPSKKTSSERGQSNHLIVRLLSSESRSISAPRDGRICLLKGCGRRFVPRPQDLLRAKYCSPACREKAKKWKAWQKRHSEEGREAKRGQDRRFRKTHPDYFRQYRRENSERVREIERASKRCCRSRNFASAPGDVHKVPPMKIACRRPGCYRFLSMVGRSPYCSDSCRKVMRCYSNLLAQLRYRRTRVGNYRRKLARGAPRASLAATVAEADL